MCGITGFLDPRSGLSQEQQQAAIGAMNQALFHRGPDDGGEWLDPRWGVALANRRLAIIDLSPEGHQPMLSADGRLVIAFNGEIYNYAELRRWLEQEAPVPWRGHSDTEVLVEAIARWGAQTALERTVGMFAFAVWDRHTRSLTLARDRAGEKPLYYGQIGTLLLFGSELKALRSHPAWRGAVDRNAVALYLRHNCIPAPYSIYQGIHKLPPGTYLRIEPGQASGAPVPYWSAHTVVRAGTRATREWDEAEAIDELHRRLAQAVAGQMLADVPLGAFLSGGIDSSTIVAIMQEMSTQPVRTFTIGFHDATYNEADHARAVAAHLGTQHTELYVTSEETQAVIPKLPTLYDEPFADSSQIPTYLVAALARQDVTVALSGDAGDELFGGYNRYFWGRDIWSRVSWIPAPARQLAGSAIGVLSPLQWDLLFAHAEPVLPARMKQRAAGDKLHKLADVLGVDSLQAMYWRLVSHWKHPETVVLGGHEPETIISRRSAWPELPGFVEQMMYLDLVTYLPDDILVKVDRAAMAVSLETRVPFLDHRMIEFAWQLPLSFKVRNGQGKWILRRLLDRYVPAALIERPKTGFGIPIDRWLRGPLRPWAEALLSEERLLREGYFEPSIIRRTWAEHLSGRQNWQYHLWDILMFQAWLETVA